jgi:hypothetical protein
MDSTALVLNLQFLMSLCGNLTKKLSPKSHPRNMGSKVDIHLHP